MRTDNAYEIFNNVVCIVFNYDRCIEHYLYQAVQNYFAIGEADARTLISSLQIYHPYGLIGMLPWQNPVSSCVFGGRRNARLLDIAANISTFTERMNDGETLAAIRNHVVDAETIVFLGFAFHPLNMQLLSPEKEGKPKRVFATTFGMSNADADTVQHDINRMLKFYALEWMMTSGKCVELFDQYWRSLPRGL